MVATCHISAAETISHKRGRKAAKAKKLRDSCKTIVKQIHKVISFFVYLKQYVSLLEP